MKLIVFFALIGAAFGGGLQGGLLHSPLLAAPAVHLAPQFSVHETSIPAAIPVHHPAKTTIVDQPTSVLAQAPKLSGYSYTSEVKHNAQAKLLAPIVHAPIVHSAPILAAPQFVKAAPVIAQAPLVQQLSVHAAPTVIQEPARFSSYSVETSKNLVDTRVHYSPVVTAIQHPQTILATQKFVSAPILAAQNLGAY